MPSSFKIALAQMLVEPGQKIRNLARAGDYVSRAALAGARIIILPEAMTLGWTHPSARTEADAVPASDTCEQLRAWARENRIYICTGLVERAGERLYNSALVISPTGEIVLHHRKIHELDFACELYAIGDRVQVAQTELGCLGLMICADGFAPNLSISRTLGLMGARVILSPSAWAVAADHDNTREPYGQLWRDSYAPVAQEFGCWIIGVSNVGPVTAGAWAGRKCIGCSLVMGPEGREVLQGPYGENAEALLFIEVPSSDRS
jgi:predicted amidohydrolase